MLAFLIQKRIHCTRIGIDNNILPERVGFWDAAPQRFTAASAPIA